MHTRLLLGLGNPTVARFIERLRGEEYNARGIFVVDWTLLLALVKIFAIL
jgi:hypothetical protein